MNERSFDAVVIGSGPNGLAAAIELARAGLKVLVREGSPSLGGGSRSAELTLPGFIHDVCSSVQAMVEISPFFRTVPLNQYGCELIHPPAAFAHPLDDGAAAIAYRSLEETAAKLGEDANAYRELFGPLVARWEDLSAEILGPPRVPRHPLLMMRFGLDAIRSAYGLARSRFRTREAQALFAGAAAHSLLPLEWNASAAFAIVLALAGHAHGWPVARGGAQTLADALMSYLRSLGGEIVANAPVENIDELSHATIVMCDIGPHQLVRIAGHKLPDRYRKRLDNYRYGPGAFKIDYALDGPIPWANAECLTASTVHVGGTIEEIAASERTPWEKVASEKPFVLVVQPSLFDPSRAPAGKHTAWAYCHVPNGCTVDMTERIENQIERFAPGFRERVLARKLWSPAEMQRHNPNLVGGDVNGGAQDLGQLFTRPIAKLNPYATPVDGLYLCSASTPPGGGVHGMCGSFAAGSALRRLR